MFNTKSAKRNGMPLVRYSDSHRSNFGLFRYNPRYANASTQIPLVAPAPNVGPNVLPPVR